MGQHSTCHSVFKITPVGPNCSSFSKYIKIILIIFHLFLMRIPLITRILFATQYQPYIEKAWCLFMKSVLPSLSSSLKTNLFNYSRISTKNLIIHQVVSGVQEKWGLILGAVHFMIYKDMIKADDLSDKNKKHISRNILVVCVRRSIDCQGHLGPINV